MCVCVYFKRLLFCFLKNNFKFKKYISTTTTNNNNHKFYISVDKYIYIYIYGRVKTLSGIIFVHFILFYFDETKTNQKLKKFKYSCNFCCSKMECKEEHKNNKI